jgi:hypothetical protein
MTTFSNLALLNEYCHSTVTPGKTLLMRRQQT